MVLFVLCNLIIFVICSKYLSLWMHLDWNLNCLVTSVVSSQRCTVLQIVKQGHDGHLSHWSVVFNIPEYRWAEDSLARGWRSWKKLDKLEKKERNYQWRMPNAQTFLTGSAFKKFSVPKSLVAGPEIFLGLQYLDTLKQWWSFMKSNKGTIM